MLLYQRSLFVFVFGFIIIQRGVLAQQGQEALEDSNPLPQSTQDQPAVPQAIEVREYLFRI